MDIWYALAAAFTVMLVSLIGVVFAVGRVGSWVQRYLTYLATLSAGVFLLIAYHLAEEAVHEGGWIVGVGSIILGAAIMEGIHYFFPLEHHHHEHEESHAHTRVDGRKVLAADALHNVGDGILLVGAFASDVYVGIAATVGVLLHEMVQEISEYFVLREAGYSHAGALTRNFLVASTILIGFVFATFLSSGPILAILSGLAAGGFLSVVLHDLLPHAYHSV
jgi:zinc and cadmium transporter